MRGVSILHDLQAHYDRAVEVKVGEFNPILTVAPELLGIVNVISTSRSTADIAGI